MSVRNGSATSAFGASCNDQMLVKQETAASSKQLLDASDAACTAAAAAATEKLLAPTPRRTAASARLSPLLSLALFPHLLLPVSFLLAPF